MRGEVATPISGKTCFPDCRKTELKLNVDLIEEKRIPHQLLSITGTYLAPRGTRFAASTLRISQVGWGRDRAIDLAAFRGSDGKRERKSAGISNRADALRLAVEWERLAKNGRRKQFVAVQARKVISEITEQATGEPLHDKSAQESPRILFCSALHRLGNCTWRVERRAPVSCFRRSLLVLAHAGLSGDLFADCSRLS